MKRTVIITGGTKGLGRELSLAFAQTGCTVVALYSSDDIAAQELLADFRRLSVGGLAVRHEVRSRDPLVWSLSEIQEAEHLTVIHNACAAFAPIPMHQLECGDFEKQFSVAVEGTWACTQPLLRLMVKRKCGTIVTVLSSVVHSAPPKGFAAYAVAKHALRGLTLALAAEYSGRGVKVFSVSPGYMATPLTQRWDARLREAVRANSLRVTDPAVAARRIVELVMRDDIPAAGEDYPL